MSNPKRRPTTVYLDYRIAQAIKMKAAVTGDSVSDLVNDALAVKLGQDESDLRIAHERKRAPTRSYDDFLKDLKRDGLI